MEGRIQELDMLLATARVIEREEKVHPDGTVVIGSTVTIQEQGFEAETYTIVGAAEANPREGKISNESPIGKAILNHEIGETVPVETPSGTYKASAKKMTTSDDTEYAYCVSGNTMTILPLGGSVGTVSGTVVLEAE